MVGDKEKNTLLKWFPIVREILGNCSILFKQNRNCGGLRMSMPKVQRRRSVFTPNVCIMVLDIAVTKSSDIATYFWEWHNEFDETKNRRNKENILWKMVYIEF